MTPHRSDLQAEILTATNNFLDRFGANAPREAEIRASELREAGQADAAAMWIEIANRARKKLAKNDNG